MNLEIYELFQLQVEISRPFTQKLVYLRGATFGLQLSFAVEEQLELVEPFLTVLLLIGKLLRELLALLILKQFFAALVLLHQNIETLEFDVLLSRLLIGALTVHLRQL